MRRFGSILGAALLAVAVAGGAGLAYAQNAAADAVATRQAGMKANGASAGAIKKALDAGADLTTVAANAQTIADFARKAPTLFPAGSGVESGAKTHALPAVWTGKADFDTLAGNLAAAADKLTAALKANDKAAAATAFAATGAACGACHKTYREKI